MKKNQTATQPQKSRLQRVKEGGIETLPFQEDYLVVDTNDLVENPANERKTFRNMEGLIATVKSSGILEPLIVEPLENGKYIVKLGARRLRAAKAAGIKQIPVIATEVDKSPLRRRKSIISNLQREDIGPVELAEGLQALLDEDSTITNQTALAKTIGKQKDWVSSVLKILTLPPALLARLRTSKRSIPYGVIIEIARLKDKTHQNNLIQDVLEGRTRENIREKINQLKGKKTSTEEKKPRMKYSTDHNVDIIIQSKTSTLTLDREINGLTQALKKAKSRRKS